MIEHNSTTHTNFLRVLDMEIVATEEDIEECRRKLTVLRAVRQNYSPASKGTKSANGRRGWRTATEAVASLLREEDAPLPTATLLEQLQAMGMKFAGRDPRNSLSAMLSRSRQFRAHGHRGWTLVGD